MARAKPRPAKGKAKAAKKPLRKAPKARPPAKTPAKRTTTKRRASPRAVPQPIVEREVSNEPSARRASTARERSRRSSPVVEILDNAHPIGALRRFLDSIKGPPTVQQGEIALGAAQLMLLPFARESRGGSEVKELLDMMLERWTDFPEPTGFHAQELLRNALAAVGVDRDRIAKLQALVPHGASAELLLSLACAHAVARDKVAMLAAVEAALDAGVAAAQFRRDPDFAAYKADPDLALILSHADLPPIPVDLEPYIRLVRSSLDSLVGTLREYGERVELRPPARLDAILDAERARKISLPNDFRALLTITNGMKLWDNEFFGIVDFREPTPLAVRAQTFLEMSASHGASAIEDCVPLASFGQPNDWLLYDPRGNVRGGPGYVLMQNADENPFEDLASTLAWLEQIARETFGTN
jgi:hypothetical protein